MPLPLEWIDSIFANMTVRYGSAWLAKWNGVDIAAVKADWADVLGGFQANPDAIKHALGSLPDDFPPTATQFRALCVARPEPAGRALPAPKADPAVVRKVMQAFVPKPSVDPKEWAHRLRIREQQCDRLTPAQRAMWRQALKGEVQEVAA